MRRLAYFFLLLVATSCGLKNPTDPGAFDGNYELIGIRVESPGYSTPGPENATGYLRLDGGTYTLKVSLPASVVWVKNGAQVTHDGTYTVSRRNVNFRSNTFRSNTEETYTGWSHPESPDRLNVHGLFLLPFLDISTDRMEDFILVYDREGHSLVRNIKQNQHGL